MELFYLITTALGITAVVFVFWKMGIKPAAAFMAAAAAGILIGLATQGIFAVAVKNDKETFHEYWNGSEIAATQDEVTCVRDGSCRNTYSCDPYTVTETEFYTDSEGNMQTRVVTKTKYHSCPYSNQETTYKVETTLGNFTFGQSLMTGTPFRVTRAIPGGQVTEPPKPWIQAKNRIDSGFPGPVTKMNTYKNYILASEDSIMKGYSDDIEALREQGMLPSFNSVIIEQYRSDKAFFPGVDETLMSKKLQNMLLNDTEYMNAFTGSKLGADMRFVFVDASMVKNPYKYTNTIHAYWQSKEFGRNAIPKNAAVVVIGVEPYNAPVVEENESLEDAATDTNDEAVEAVEIKEGTPVVAWADFFTGMPVGNEDLKQEVRSNIKGTPIDENFIGKPHYVVADDDYRLSSDSTVQKFMAGFDRESMSAEDENDNGSGFKYLSAVKFDPGHYIAMIIINSILFLASMFVGFNFALKIAENE